MGNGVTGILCDGLIWLYCIVSYRYGTGIVVGVGIGVELVMGVMGVSLSVLVLVFGGVKRATLLDYYSRESGQVTGTVTGK